MLLHYYLLLEMQVSNVIFYYTHQRKITFTSFLYLSYVLHKTVGLIYVNKNGFQIYDGDCSNGKKKNGTLFGVFWIVYQSLCLA